MKKFCAFILLLVYFTVSTGFTVSLHYCMDKIDSVKIGASDSDKCSKCGMHASESNGCCRDEVKVVKLQQDQSQAFFAVIDFSLTPALPNTSNYLILPDVKAHEVKPADNIHAPPLISKQDTYLTNCVFRI